MCCGSRFFSKANAQGYCDSTGASEDADGVITFSGDEGSIGFCAFAPDEYTIKIYNNIRIIYTYIRIYENIE